MAKMKESLNTQDKIKGIIDRIKKDKEVIAIILFGSYARKKEYAGDIDLCIMLDKKYS
ncbi:nucleotidyltransferase domain-containing protein, partial [Candidatus Woesearchaeota archaeon]|nr:nucleotidyltransferase domain-containing protein [Candidatus Woesearchaeota archaeon]